MDNEFKVRLKKKRNELGFSQTQIANYVGVSPQSVNQWEKGVTVPRGHRLEKLADVLTVSEEWLLFGIVDNGPGDSHLSKSGHINPPSLFDSESKLSSSSLGTPTTHSFIDIPIYDISFAAGEGAYTDDAEIADTYPISTLLLEKHNLHSSDAMIATVSGESMEPTLFHGDKVLINTSIKKAVSNKILAFVFDDSLRVKRFMLKLDRNWVIMSDNEDKNRYGDEMIAQINVNHLKIIGQVVNIVDRSLA